MMSPIEVTAREGVNRELNEKEGWWQEGEIGKVRRNGWVTEVGQKSLVDWMMVEYKVGDKDEEGVELMKDLEGDFQRSLVGGAEEFGSGVAKLKVAVEGIKGVIEAMGKGLDERKIKVDRYVASIGVFLGMVCGAEKEAKKKLIEGVKGALTKEEKEKGEEEKKRIVEGKIREAIVRNIGGELDFGEALKYLGEEMGRRAWSMRGIRVVEFFLGMKDFMKPGSIRMVTEALSSRVLKGWIWDSEEFPKSRGFILSELEEEWRGVCEWYLGMVVLLREDEKIGKGVEIGDILDLLEVIWKLCEKEEKLGRWIGMYMETLDALYVGQVLICKQGKGRLLGMIERVGGRREEAAGIIAGIKFEK